MRGVRAHHAAQAMLRIAARARRYVAQVIAESAGGGGGEARPFYSFLESCLRHKAEMVIFEAARAICAMRDVSTRELAPAVTVLQLFLSSSKPVLRFAAVRTLNKARPGPATPHVKLGRGRPVAAVTILAYVSGIMHGPCCASLARPRSATCGRNIAP